MGLRALVLGCTGQDGSYLAEQLIDDGVEVFGVVRRPTLTVPGVVRVQADLLDQASLEAALRLVRPDEVYNLAAVTAPGGAWGTPQPPLLADVTALGVVRLLDAVAAVCPDASVVHASSSAVHDPHRYGLYGISKRFAHDAVAGYRNRLRCSNAVLYSHTSPRQDGRFLAPTIIRRLAGIARGEPGRLLLTDIIGRRDWGWAPDFTLALPLIARATPGDWTVATGRLRTVREFVEAALIELELDWDAAVDLHQGDVAPAETRADIQPIKTLGWRPWTPLPAMVRQMVEAA